MKLTEYLLWLFLSETFLYNFSSNFLNVLGFKCFSLKYHFFSSEAKYKISHIIWLLVYAIPRIGKFRDRKISDYQEMRDGNGSNYCTECFSGVMKKFETRGSGCLLLWMDWIPLNCTLVLLIIYYVNFTSIEKEKVYVWKFFIMYF